MNECCSRLAGFSTAAGLTHAVRTLAPCAIAGQNRPVQLSLTFLKKGILFRELHLLDTGYFALEEDGLVIAEWIHGFLASKLVSR